MSWLKHIYCIQLLQQDFPNKNFIKSGLKVQWSNILGNHCWVFQTLWQDSKKKVSQLITNLQGGASQRRRFYPRGAFGNLQGCFHWSQWSEAPCNTVKSRDGKPSTTYRAAANNEKVSSRVSQRLMPCLKFTGEKIVYNFMSLETKSLKIMSPATSRLVELSPQ